MEIGQIIDDLALQESLGIIDDDLFASIDDFDKAEAEI